MDREGLPGGAAFIRAPGSGARYLRMDGHSSMRKRRPRSSWGRRLERDLGLGGGGQARPAAPDFTVWTQEGEQRRRTGRGRVGQRFGSGGGAGPGRSTLPEPPGPPRPVEVQCGRGTGHPRCGLLRSAACPAAGKPRPGPAARRAGRRARIGPDWKRGAWTQPGLPAAASPVPRWLRRDGRVRSSPAWWQTSGPRGAASETTATGAPDRLPPLRTGSAAAEAAGVRPANRPPCGWRPARRGRGTRPQRAGRWR